MDKFNMPYKVTLTIEDSVFELVEINSTEYQVIMDTAHYYDPYFLYKRDRILNRDDSSDSKYAFRYMYKAIVINGKYFIPVLKTNVEQKKQDTMSDKRIMILKNLAIIHQTMLSSLYLFSNDKERKSKVNGIHFTIIISLINLCHDLRAEFCDAMTEDERNLIFDTLWKIQLKFNNENITEDDAESVQFVIDTLCGKNPKKPVNTEPTFEQAVNECQPEAVNHPKHYGGENNPYEAINVIEAHNLGFNLGNTVKYILRAGKKGSAKEDLEKAVWYLKREIGRL